LTVLAATQSIPGASRHLLRRRLGRLGPLLPMLIYLALLFLIPVAQLLLLSAADNDGHLSSVQYRRLFASDAYVRVILITFKISAWTTLITVVAAYPIAYRLATRPDQAGGLMMLLILLPLWTSFLVRTFAWIILLGRNGAINGWLKWIGLTDAPLSLMYNSTGVLIGMTHAMLPLAIFTMLPVMQSIPGDLAKAAGTLGARPGQAFWLVYFPLSLPGVTASGLMVFITSIGFFITPTFLGGNQQTMITQVIIEQIQTLPNWGFAGAVSVLLLVTTLGFVAAYDALFGMSTLTPTAAEARARSGVLADAAARIGKRLAHAMARLSGGASRLAGRIGRIGGNPTARRNPGRIRKCVTLLLVTFIALPPIFIVPISFSQSEFMDWPPKGFTLEWYESYFVSGQWISGTVRSLLVGVLTGLLATLIAAPAAFAFTRREIPGRSIWFALALSPLIVPRIIIALGLFHLYAQLGLIGTSLGLVLGHTVLAIPYVMLTLMAVLRLYDRRLDQAAATLGANRWNTFWRVTFPLIRPGILSGFLFAFLVSFDELTIALFVTGGLTVTLPKLMWDAALLSVNPGLAAVSSIMLVFVTCLIVATEVLRRRSMQK
jgi:putative spermidine/putrescine transport system permease protein